LSAGIVFYPYTYLSEFLFPSALTTNEDMGRIETIRRYNGDFVLTALQFGSLPSNHQHLQYNQHQIVHHMSNKTLPFNLDLLPLIWGRERINSVDDINTVNSLTTPHSPYTTTC
jgi:hypothetical protein